MSSPTPEGTETQHVAKRKRGRPRKDTSTSNTVKTTTTTGWRISPRCRSSPPSLDGSNPAFVPSSSTPTSSSRKRKREHHRSSRGRKGSDIGRKKQQRARQDAEMFIVEGIVNRRLTKAMTGVEYKVRWAGYDASADSWEPMPNLLADNLGDLIGYYEERKLAQLSEKRVKLPQPRPATMKSTHLLPSDGESLVGKKTMKFFMEHGLQIGRVKKYLNPNWLVSFPSREDLEVKENELLQMILLANEAYDDVKRRKKAYKGATYKGTKK